MKNRHGRPPGHSGALGTASGSSGDASKSAPGRAETRPGRPKSGLGTPQVTPRSPWNGPGALPRQSRGVSQRSFSPFALPYAFRNARGSIFKHVSLITRKLRCAICTIATSVLLASDEMSIARVRAAKNIENLSVSASKIEPRSDPGRPGRAKIDFGRLQVGPGAAFGLPQRHQVGPGTASRSPRRRLGAGTKISSRAGSESPDGNIV